MKNGTNGSLSTGLRNLWFPILAFAMLAIPIVGMWELLRPDRPVAIRVTSLLVVFIAVFSLAIIALVAEYFTTRILLGDAKVANQRLQMVMASGRSVGWEWDLASGRDYWYGDLRTMFGIPSNTWSGQVDEFFGYVHPDDRERVSQAVTEARVNRKPYEAEFRVVRQDGTVRWVTATGSFYYSKSSKPERMLGMAVDITERKQTEEGLKKSEEKFSKAFRESPMALTLTSAIDHRYVDINETFEQITGWRRDEVIGRTPFDIQIWANPQERIEFVKRLQTEGSVRNLEVRFRCKDGSDRIGLGSAELIEIDNEPCIISVIADITERKQIQERLRESQERLSGVVASAMDAILATDEGQRIVLFNAAAEKMFGCTANQAIGTSVERFIPPQFRSGRAQHILNFGQSGTTNPTMDTLGTLNAVRANGEEFPIEASISNLDADGNKLFIIIIRDVTERRRAEEALRGSEQRLRLAVQAGRMYVDEWNALTDVIVRSPECVDILGKDAPLQTSRRQFLEQIHADDRQQFEESFSRITPQNPGSQVSYRIVHADGSTIWLEKRSRGFFDNAGKLISTLGVVVDVSDRKQSELALRTSEERFRRVVELIGDAVIVDDVAGHLVFANDNFLRLFGFQRDQLPTLRLEDYVAPEYRTEARDRHDRRMRGEAATTHFEYEGIRSNGTRMWLDVDVAPIADQTGKLVGTQSAIRDITERKRAEQALRESEERFRLVANSAPVMIWLSGPEKLCIYFNQQWLEFTGRPLEAELGHGWTEGVHPDDLKACLETYKQAFDKREPFDMQYRLRRHDGQYRWIQDKGVPRFEPDGSFAGYIGSCNDVTDRELAADLLGSLGRRLIEAHEQERTWIARELHDDINQRLALLAIELEKWKQQLPESIDLSGHIERARKRIFDVSKDVQSLSHRLHSSKLEYLGIATAAKSFCRELSDQHKVRIDFVHFDVPPNLPKEASLALFRVLQEALQNAVKHSRAKDFKVELRGTPDEIHLTVSDSGAGFDQREALASRGLGLVSMRERLQLVNGTMVIESEPGRGTTIRARVPIKADVESTEPQRMIG
jgi:PAS domain S-box-containing protein